MENNYLACTDFHTCRCCYWRGIHRLVVRCTGRNRARLHLGYSFETYFSCVQYQHHRTLLLCQLVDFVTSCFEDGGEERDTQSGVTLLWRRRAQLNISFREGCFDCVAMVLPEERTTVDILFDQTAPSTLSTVYRVID